MQHYAVILLLVALFCSYISANNSTSDTCLSVSGDVLCVGDMSTASLFNSYSSGFKLLKYSSDSKLPSDTLGYWKFDTKNGNDETRFGNHFSAPVPPAGVGILRGASGYFDGKTVYSIPHNDAYGASEEITISAWVYLLSDVADSFQGLFRKGNGKTVDAFDLKVWPSTRLLRGSAGSLSVNTQASVPLHRWTHIAMRVSPLRLDIFMNGALVGSSTAAAQALGSVSTIKLNRDPLFIASSPDHSVFGVHAYIDELKLVKGMVSPVALKSESAMATSGVPSGMDIVWLGCDECNKDQAMEACAQKSGVQERKPSHLCTELELAAGAFTVARNMGWLAASADGHVLTLEKKSRKRAKGVGLCCLNE